MNPPLPNKRRTMGMSNACKKTENCEFYTHSRVTSFNWAFYAEKPDFPLFQCFLWKSCDNFTLPFDGMFPFSWKAISDNWSGPRDCSRFKQKCPIFSSEFQPQDPPDGYKYTQCFVDGVHLHGDQKILLQKLLEARSFEDPCRFCTECGEVCGYEVSLYPSFLLFSTINSTLTTYRECLLGEKETREFFK